jgi:3-deoxy-D-manno-octulosonic-acid transferase
MIFLYNLLLIIVSIITLPYWIIRVLFTKKYRQNIIQRFSIYPKETIAKLNGKKPVWIHAVSVGETLAAIILVKSLKKKYLDLPILISTVTVTGNQIAKQNEKLFDGIIYFPLDFPFSVKRVISFFSPRLILVMEKELWPNFLFTTKKRNIPCILVNGRLAEKSVKKYLRWKFFMKNTLNSLTQILMQTKEDAERMKLIGADPSRIQVTGNLKFDLSPPTISPQELSELKRQFGITSPEQPVFIAGSTHPGEEEFVLDALHYVKKRFPNTKLILAPRHPERCDEVEKLIQQKGFSCVRRSKMSSSSENNYDVYLIDKVGELFKLYILGNAVFVGGSLVPVGGHNILEPAVCERAVVFGPYMHNFQESADLLLNANGALQITSGADLSGVIERLLISLEESQIRGKACADAIKSNTGATERTLKIIEKYL